MQAFNWSETPPTSKSSGSDKFYKYVPGVNKFRFVSKPYKYTRQWPDGLKTSYCALAYCGEQGLKIVDIKKNTLDVLRQFIEENDVQPHADSAPIFSVTKTGEQKETRYVTTYSIKMVPVPASVTADQIKTAIADMEKIVTALEAKAEEKTPEPKGEAKAEDVEF